MIFAKNFFIFLLAIINVANSVKGPQVKDPVRTLLEILKNAINHDITTKEYDFRQAGTMSARMTPVGNADVIGATVSNISNSLKGHEVTVPVNTRRQIVNNAINYKRGIMSARRTLVGNADVRGVPPEACFAKFRWDNCGLPAQPVFYYYKPGARCEIGFWRGCRPNANMFKNEFECANTCIYTVRARPDGFSHILSEEYGDGDGNGDIKGDDEKILGSISDSGSEGDTEEQDPPGLPDLRSICTGEYQYVPRVGGCYRVSKEKATWDDAAAACRADDAYLVVINSVLERQVVHRLIPEDLENWYYFAGFKAEKSRVFKTVFNETLEEAGCADWLPGEPNNYNGNEYCGCICSYREGKFNDLNCAYKYKYICEKD